MQTGRLRHYITIQEQVIARDAYGAEVISWQNVLTGVPADILSLSGMERFQTTGDQVVGMVIYSIRIRYRTGIDVKMRVLWNSQVLEINEVLDRDGRRRELFLRCTEVLD